MLAQRSIVLLRDVCRFCSKAAATQYGAKQAPNMKILLATIIAAQSHKKFTTFSDILFPSLLELLVIRTVLRKL
jgi:hypothetical protein